MLLNIVYTILIQTSAILVPQKLFYYSRTIAWPSERQTRMIRQVLVLIITLLVGGLGILIARLPHLLLRVPKIGFALFAQAGGEVPGYFDGKIFQNDEKWLRKNDVILAVCTKCGTTWMMQTIHNLRTKGNPPPFRDIYEEVRWAEFVYYPGQSMEERIEILKRQAKVYSISAFKTHKQPPEIRYREDVKYVIGIRSFVDAAASLRDFLPNHDPHFAKMWGGFPVDAGKTLTRTAEDDKVFEHMLMHDIGNGRPMLDILCLDLVRGWWPYRNKKNVLFVHYSNRIRDHKGQLARLAQFLDLNLTPSELDLVAERSTFAAMKNETEKYEIGPVFDEFKDRGLVSRKMATVVKELVNIGPKRDGLKELPKTIIEGIKEKIFSEFGQEIGKYLLEGGDLPDVDLPTSK